jgi:heme exporter protein D
MNPAGQYAIFVVPAYVLTLLVFVSLAAMAQRRLKHWAARAAEREGGPKSKPKAAPSKEAEAP